MPFLSKKQNAWAHTEAGTKALGGADKVKEWEQSTDFSQLPEKKTPPKKLLGGAVTASKGWKIG